MDLPHGAGAEGSNPFNARGRFVDRPVTHGVASIPVSASPQVPDITEIAICGARVKTAAHHPICCRAAPALFLISIIFCLEGERGRGDAYSFVAALDSLM
jgi:hypothetical protein